MKRRISLISMILVVFMFLSGCGQAASPDTVVEELIGSMQKFDFNGVVKAVDPAKGLAEEEINAMVFSDEEVLEESFFNYLKDNAANITYEIKETKVDGDHATSTVNFTYTDSGELLTATLAEFIDQMFTLAFSGEEVTDEKSNELLLSILEEQIETVKTASIEETITIPLVQIDGKWYVEELNENLINVMMSNFVSSMGGENSSEEESSDATTKETPAVSEEEASSESNTKEEETEAGPDVPEAPAASEPTKRKTRNEGRVTSTDKSINIMEIYLGEEIPLSTMNVVVEDFDETLELTSEFWDPVIAKEGTKFVTVTATVTNTTRFEETLVPPLILMDDQNRQFTTYDATFAIDDYLDFITLAPSIKEEGRFIFEVPMDSNNSVLLFASDETKDLYFVFLDPVHFK